MLPLRSTLLILMLTGAAAAEPLAEMDGTWRGSGWARETPQGPKETVRCQIRNAYDAATGTLTVTGQCGVPGRRLSISGTLTADKGSGRITGSWSNPDGIGNVAVVGLQRDGIVAFNFKAPDLGTGCDLAQNVEWRVSEDSLQLRSSDRANPEIRMSDILFSP